MFRILAYVTCIVLHVGSPCPTRSAEKDFASVEDIAFASDVDGSRQRYVLMTPRGHESNDTRSLLIALHGHGSDRWQFVRQQRGECKAARDIAVRHRMFLIAPDYRASTSWMGPAAEADLVQIIRNAKRQFQVERVLLCGGSMGGTAALTFTALHPDLVDGVAAFNGTANLVEYDRFQDAIAQSFGGTRTEVPEEYKKRSAEYSPRSFTVPLAVTTGGKDTVVPGDSVLRLVGVIRKWNNHVLSIHRPTGGHSTSYTDALQALQFVVDASGQRIAKR